MGDTKWGGVKENAFSHGRGRKAGLVCAWGLLFSLPLGLLGNQDGPPAGHTGGFGEPDCRQCHFDHPLNAPGYRLRVGGLPERYEPGQRYTLTVSVEPEPKAAGFELSVRFAEGQKKGLQAGELQPAKGLFATGLLDVILSDSPAGEDSGGSPPPNSELPRIQYARHTRQGPPRWALSWTAPEAAEGPVVFHVAANAANGDVSPFGDFIYTLEEIRAPEGETKGR